MLIIMASWRRPFSQGRSYSGKTEWRKMADVEIESA